MSFYVEDSTDARRNRVTNLGGTGVAYNTVLSTVFSDEATGEPVTLSEAKAWCRIDVTDDDPLITALITAARIVCENYANLSFKKRTVTAKIHNGLGNFVLPYGPLDGNIISATDSDGNAIADLDLSKASDSDLTVIYKTGTETLAGNLKTALFNQIAFMYENRGTEKESSALSELSKLLLSQVRES